MRVRTNAFVANVLDRFVRQDRLRKEVGQRALRNATLEHVLRTATLESLPRQPLNTSSSRKFIVVQLEPLSAREFRALHEPDLIFLRIGPEYPCYGTGDRKRPVLDLLPPLLPIAVKATARSRVGDAKHLRTFREEYCRHCRPGLVLHTRSSGSRRAS